MASPSPQAAPPAVSRRAWLFVTGAFAESFLVAPVVGWFLARGRGDAVLRPVPALWLLGSGALLVAGAAVARRARGGPPSAFLHGSILAMAALEVNALLGLALSVAFRDVTPALLLPGLSLAVALLVVFPTGLAYWRGAAVERPRIDPT